MEFDHYLAMVFLSVLCALVLMVLIAGSTRLKKDVKRLFLLSTALLLVASVTEYLGVYLDGAPYIYRPLHIALKVFELSISPFLVFVLVFALNGYRHARYILPVCACNLILEITSGFTGLLYYVDAQNFYHHNTYYWLYTLVYVLCGTFFFHECILFSKQYQNRNSASLCAILAFLIAGLSIHSLHSTIRADWLTLIVAEALFYIYYTALSEQMDSLTCLLDRKSYDICIASLRQKAIILFFDIDFFKEINDSYGHEAGDACLQAVSAVLKRSYGKYGLCYRIGGDEFCVIITKAPADLPAINFSFYAALKGARISEKNLPIPNVSLGYAGFDPKNGRIADTIQAADAMMYKAKKDRRNSFADSLVSCQKGVAQR